MFKAGIEAALAQTAHVKEGKNDVDCLLIIFFKGKMVNAVCQILHTGPYLKKDGHFSNKNTGVRRA